MIPVDYNEPIKYKDPDSGVVFSLRPMVGPNEAKVVSLIYENDGSDNNLVSRSAIDEIFDMFVVDWKHENMLLPKCPETNQHQYFRAIDRNKLVFDVILNQTKDLTVDEKKS